MARRHGFQFLRLKVAQFLLLVQLMLPPPRALRLPRSRRGHCCGCWSGWNLALARLLLLLLERHLPAELPELLGCPRRDVLLAPTAYWRRRRRPNVVGRARTTLLLLLLPLL